MTNNDDILDTLRLLKRLQEATEDREAWLVLTMAYEHVARGIQIQKGETTNDERCNVYRACTIGNRCSAQTDIVLSPESISSAQSCGSTQ